MVNISSGFRINQARKGIQGDRAWDLSNYRYDMRRGNKAGAKWALERAAYDRRRK